MDKTFVLDFYEDQKFPRLSLTKLADTVQKMKKRGISKEYICICSGVQRKNCAIAKKVNRAKPSSEELQEIFGKRIENGILILCDGLKSYHSLEKVPVVK